VSTFPPYQPPAPDLPLSKRFTEDADKATELVADVRARLDEGETLLCLLSVAKIQPPLDYLAVTNSRVLAGWRGDLNNLEKNLPVVIPIEAVNGIEVSGFMDNVRFELANGDDLKVGNLWDANDEETLRSAVRTAQSWDQSSEGDPAAPPTYELYHRADPDAD
jgi:hypothetical protein